MAYPRIEDDGQAVTLDLHGARIAEALTLAQRAVREAARRGRGSVKIVHGQSTTESLYQNRTIKNALYDLLDRGALSNTVSHAWRAEGYVLLSLDVSASSQPSRIRMSDISKP